MFQSGLDDDQILTTQLHGPLLQSRSSGRAVKPIRLAGVYRHGGDDSLGYIGDDWYQGGWTTPLGLAHGGAIGYLAEGGWVE